MKFRYYTVRVSDFKSVTKTSWLTHKITTTTSFRPHMETLQAWDLDWGISKPYFWTPFARLFCALSTPLLLVPVMVFFVKDGDWVENIGPCLAIFGVLFSIVAAMGIYALPESAIMAKTNAEFPPVPQGQTLLRLRGTNWLQFCVAVGFAPADAPKPRQ